MKYQFCTKNEVLILNGEDHDNLYIILDGQVEFSVDYDKEEFKASDLKDIANDLGVSKKDLEKDFNDYNS